MEKGFIMLSRKFFSNEMWEAARTFSECEAWLDLIQGARFDATRLTASIGGREITYERGQYPASNRFLAKRWKWGEQKVKGFLDKLRRKGMITTDNSQGLTVITLVKYEDYNSNNPANNPTINPDNTFDINKLQELVTQCVTQQITQLQPSGNPNNNKENKEYKEYSSSSDELLCETLQPHPERINYDELIKFFNSETKGVFGTIRAPLSDIRKKMIGARIKTHGKEAFAGMIKTAYRSDFLKGQNKQSWRATFDWLIKPTNFEKVISGNYDNKNISDNSANGNNEDFMRNVAEGIARADFEKRQRREEH